jgi:DNA-binding IclR family transcriptional regulator
MTNDIIIDCLRAYGPLGKDGIARITGLLVNQCSRALPLLERQGLIEQTGRTVLSDSKRREREWRIK